jgi:hypothetical protein
VKRTPVEKLLSPVPGGRIASARDFGIDLSLIAENMRLTPEEKLRKLQSAMNSFEKLRKEAAKSKRIDQ